jgi:hypothetical protein
MARKDRKYMAAWNTHAKSKRKLEQAARDVERHQMYLFVALKHQEKVVSEYTETAKALAKLHT